MKKTGNLTIKFGCHDSIINELVWERKLGETPLRTDYKRLPEVKGFLQFAFLPEGFYQLFRFPLANLPILPGKIPSIPGINIQTSNGNVRSIHVPCTLYKQVVKMIVPPTILSIKCARYTKQFESCLTRKSNVPQIQNYENRTFQNQISALVFDCWNV